MTELNDTLRVAREAPKVRSFVKPFWDGTRAQKLMLQYDPTDGSYQFFPRVTGMRSGRRNLEWRQASGKGQVFTYTVARRAREPFRGHEPFLIAMVTLDEGVNIMANIVNCPADKIAIGLRVKLCWTPLPDGTQLFMFEPEH
jgi:uncharacterized OB-fold protein